jgi:hypothetical protein
MNVGSLLLKAALVRESVPIAGGLFLIDGGSSRCRVCARGVLELAYQGGLDHHDHFRLSPLPMAALAELNVVAVAVLLKDHWAMAEAAEKNVTNYCAVDALTSLGVDMAPLMREAADNWYRKQAASISTTNTTELETA